MELLEKFSLFIAKENLFSKKDRLLIAVSGGMDSVVLCDLCKRSGYDFGIAHANFQLRGEESERDQQFALQLGSEYGVVVWVKRFDTERYASEKKLSIQVAARELRYAWFNAILNYECADDAVLPLPRASENPPQPLQGGDEDMPVPEGDQNSHIRTFAHPHISYILTAHHADDNLETMLMNFFKGTGIAGLRAIQSKQANLVRPLLFARKAEVAAYAEKLKLKYVEDSSNASMKYTRNYFRSELIPAIRKVFPGVEENLAGNLYRFREIEQLYHQAIDRHKKKLMEFKGTEVHIPVLKLQKISPLQTVIYEIIKKYGFTPHQSTEVISLLDSESGKFVQSEEYRIIKNRNWLIISPLASARSQNILVENAHQDVFFDLGKLSFIAIPHTRNTLSTSNDIAQLDAAEITFPLLLRKKKQGDYFYPLGMQKKKKLSRFLTDRKLSLTQKENVWVVEMNKKIVWVVGWRIDDRFKITAKTENVLQIRLSGNG